MHWSIHYEVEPQISKVRNVFILCMQMFIMVNYLLHRNGIATNLALSGLFGSKIHYAYVWHSSAKMSWHPV